MPHKLTTTFLVSLLFLNIIATMGYSLVPPLPTETMNSASGNPSMHGVAATSNSFPVPMDISGNSYTAHPEITITSNSDFLSQKSSESWDGSGSDSDPIVITGYNFTSMTGVLISISNTDLHFTVDGNFFRVPTENYNAISLSNVTNGNITNNYFDRADSGIRLNDVDFTLIQENHFTSFVGTFVTAGHNNSIIQNYYNTTYTSVRLSTPSTYNNTVYNNTFLGSNIGVELYGSVENTVSLNNFTQSSLNSIYLSQTSSMYNVITDNIIHDSTETGITLYSYAHNNTISGNNITNVRISIRLAYSSNNTVSGNQISNTTQGISIEYASQWNQVYQNNISDVKDGYLGAYALNIYQGGNNTLHHNNISDADNGIYFRQTSENIMHHNNLTDIRAIGGNVETAFLNRIYDNSISGGTTGFSFSLSSTNNTLSRNSLEFQDRGIQLQDTSHYNTFDENEIRNATIYGIDSTSSSYLTIYNNTIINSGTSGININPSSYPVIAFNELINNGEYGLYLDTGLGGQIYNNTIKYHSTAGAYVISTNQHNISYNTFANSTIGLDLVLSSPGYVIGNTFANNSDTGLLLEGTDGVPVTDNLFDHNGIYGLRLSSSFGTPVENNTILSGAQYGIVIESGSDLSVIKNNEISNNSEYGIWVRVGPNTIRMNNISGSSVGIYVDTATTNSIESNFIAYNTDGIRLVGSDDNTILLNTIYNNTQYGVYSESGFPEVNTGNNIYNNTVISNGVYGVWLDATASSTEVKWNDFINNTDHARDSNPSNTWDGNFYDDWDQSQSYYVIISVSVTDDHPSAVPINPSMVHFMLAPTILSPVGGSDYTGDITIEWDTAYDSEGHSITYTISYTNDSGSSWYSIVNGLTNTSYYWNATSLSEGSNYQVRLVATDSESNSVQSVTGTFSIDNDAPRLDISPTNFTVELSFDTPPPVFFSAIDDNPSMAYIEWEGVPLTEYIDWYNDTETQLDFGDGSVGFGVGEHALYLVVTDIAGHETRYLFYMTVIDTTAPSIIIPEANQTFELGPHGSLLTWTVYDLAAGIYEAYFNDSLDMTNIWVSNTGTELDVDGYMPGVYNVTVVFYDTSGNNVSQSINMTVVDTTAPVISQFPADDTIEVGTTGNLLNWTVTELDPATYNITINDVFGEELVYSNGTVLLSIDDLSIGSYNITVVFYDNSGNRANDSVFITVSDTTAPEIVSPGDVLVEFGSVDNIVNWTATDVLPSNYTVYVDEANWGSGFWTNGSVLSISIDGLSVGNHTLRIYFADTTNNQDYAEVTISVQDTTPPSWTQVPRNQAIEFGSSFYYNINATDLSPLSYAINDTVRFSIDASTGEVTSLLSLSRGEYGIQVNATDGEGNILSVSFTLIVRDTTLPSWVEVPENQVIELGMDFHLDVNASDLSALSYALNDTAHFVINPASGAITNATSLEVGIYSLRIDATDSAENSITITITLTVEDTVSPELIATPYNIQYTTGTTGHAAIWMASDLDSGYYSVYIDGVLASTDVWRSFNPIVISVDGLPEGVHQVELKLYDASGNMVSDTITVTVIGFTTTTPTTSTEITTLPVEFSPMLILLIGGGVSAVVLVVLVSNLLRKRT